MPHGWSTTASSGGDPVRIYEGERPLQKKDKDADSRQSPLAGGHCQRESHSPGSQIYILIMIR